MPASTDVNFTMAGKRKRDEDARLSIREENYDFELTLGSISDEILQKELDKMLFLLDTVIPGRKRETIKEAYEVFNYLKKRGIIHEHNVTYLVNLLKDIKREDLASRLKHHHAHKVKPHKCIVVGESHSGKTALTLRLMFNSFPERSECTVNADCLRRHIYLQERIVHVEMWDTAGMESLNNTLPNHFFRDVSIVLIVFDIADEDSFSRAAKWHEEVKLRCPDDIVLFLVGNKLDLHETRVVSRGKAKKKAAELGARYFEVSAKDGRNAEVLLTEIGKALPPEDTLTSLSSSGLVLSTDAATQTLDNRRRTTRERLRSCHC